MLPKNKRLTKFRVEYILKKGKKKASTYFTYKYLPSDNKHFGILISAKTIPSAVERNRLRRQIYEIIRKIEPELGKMDLMIIVKPEVKKLEFADLETQLSTDLRINKTVHE